jgi:hypothetical protein
MALTCREYTIARAGETAFRVHGTNHCGPRDFLDHEGRIAVKYEIAITCAPRLDDRGFLLDQASLGRYIDRLAKDPTDLSCEKLAHSVAERVIAKIARDVPTCQVVGVVLKFSPAPFQASITVRFGH